MSPNALAVDLCVGAFVSLGRYAGTRPMYAKSIRLFFRNSFCRPARAVTFCREQSLSMLAYQKQVARRRCRFRRLFPFSRQKNKKYPCCHSLAFVQAVVSIAAFATCVVHNHNVVCSMELWVCHWRTAKKDSTRETGNKNNEPHERKMLIYLLFAYAILYTNNNKRCKWRWGAKGASPLSQCEKK